MRCFVIDKALYLPSLEKRKCFLQVPVDVCLAIFNRLEGIIWKHNFALFDIT